MDWYYARGEERMGPVDDATVAQLVAAGAITPNTLVWRADMADWQPYGRVGHQPAGDTAAPAFAEGGQAAQTCAECGLTFPADEMLSYESYWVCGGCKDAFFQRVREGGAIPGSLNCAGFWVRFFARVVDGFILGFISLVQSVAQPALTGGYGFDPSRDTSVADVIIAVVSTIISIAIGIGYETFFVGRYAATPGKMIFGLAVVRSDGGRVTYARAAGRYFATVLSTMTLMIGYVIAAFDEQKRALHDHICDTRVVHR